VLRLIVGLLLLANIAFYVWSQGWVDGLVGVRAHGDHEPERLAKQVRPEAVRILTPQLVAAAAVAAESRLACLEAGPYDDASLPVIESALASTLPVGTWTRQTSSQPARWIVYMGRYANREAQQKKEQELGRLRVPFEPVTGAPALEPGLSLGRFLNREAADAALQKLADRGIHTGKVVELAKASSQHMLRVERADPELASKVTGLRLEALGKGFGACASAAVQSAER
jgi:hypothetical protein